MNNVVIMCMLHREAGSMNQLCGLTGPKESPFPNQLVERCSIDKAHSDEHFPVDLANVINRTDRGMIEPRDGSCFPVEPTNHQRLNFGLLQLWNLDSHVPFKHLVAAPVNGSHLSGP